MPVQCAFSPASSWPGQGLVALLLEALPLQQLAVAFGLEAWPSGPAAWSCSLARTGQMPVCQLH